MSPRVRPGDSGPREGAPRPSPYVAIRDLIVSGKLAPGTALLENALAERFRVSRTPIREALVRLEQDGLLERVDRGLLVRELSGEDIIDFYDTRVVLEATAARTAAERRSDHDVALLASIAEHAERVSAQEPARMVTTNVDFHRAVWRAGRNQALIDLLERLLMHIGRYQETTLTYPGRWEQSNLEHRALVDAIRDRDGARAAAIATEHFSTARDIRVQLWLRRD